MRSFWTLFRYEMKKIWKRPLLWVTILLMAALFAYNLVWVFLPTKGGATFTAVDAEGREISRFITGDEQQRIELEGGRRLAGQVMDETFFRKAKETIPTGMDWYETVGWFMLVDPSFYQFWFYNSEALTGTAEDYYAARREAIDLELRDLSDSDRAYWEAMEARVEKPFVYQPEYGMKSLCYLLSSGGIVFFVPLLAGAALCELFARERRARMETLLFSSRRGRRTLYFAKILAGGLSAVLAVALVAAVTLAVYLALYGAAGWNGTIQLLTGAGLTASSWPITMGQGALILLGLTLLFALLCGGLAAAVSVFTGSGIAAMAACIVMMLLATRYIQGTWAQYLPARLITLDAFRDLTLTDLFGLKLNIFQSGALLYAVVALALLVLCRLGWRRWAAGK